MSISRAMPVVIPGRTPALAISAALLAVGLAGCAAKMPSPPGTDRYLVEPVRLSHQVAFAPDAGQLSAAEGLRLVDFLNEVDPDGDGSVYLDARGDSQNERIAAVASVLDKLGRETRGSSAGLGDEHGVTVTLVQDVVLPESCLNGDQWPDPRLAPASCTQSLTLIEMVEDPDDLLRGRTMGPALSETAARAAARHLGRTPAPADEERPAAVEPTTPRLPPSPHTREASY